MPVLRALAGRVPRARVATLLRLREPKSGDILDDALILVLPAPASATGEDIVEYQCHGGRAVVERLLDVIARQPRCRRAEAGEFTRRALANGRIDLTEAEGLADLLEAETESQRRAAILMAEGGLSAQIEQWRARMVELSARAEAAIDYVGDEDETAVDSAALVVGARTLREDISAWLERPRAEPLREGIRVVLAGPPNAGKSSLLNALAGSDRAIVTELAGTTRDSIEVPVNVGGVPITLIDTAGIRETEDLVERVGIARSRRETDKADILLWLGDAELAPAHPRRILLHPRCDAPERAGVSPGALAVSAVTHEGIPALWEHILRESRSLLPAEGELALNRRQAGLLEEAVVDLEGVGSDDILLTAHALRQANGRLDQLTGRSSVESMLDALFGRFCLGK